MGKYKTQLTQLRQKLDKSRPDMLISIGKSLFLAFLVFTTLSGFVFTVLPLVMNMWRHTQIHIIAPINQWIAEEPVFGNHMIFVIQLAATAMFLWLIRHWILFLWLWFLTLFEGDKTKTKQPSTNKSKVTPPKTVGKGRSVTIRTPINE